MASHRDPPVTRRRRLRTGTSYWSHDGAPAIRTRPLAQDAIADVVVIGAGISGILVAHALVESGRDVTLVDRRDPLTGSTLASTALLQFEIDTPLRELSTMIGTARARRAWRRSLRGVRALIALVDRLGVPCDLRPCQSLFLAGHALGARALEREHAARRAGGLPGRFLDRAALERRFGIARPAAILSPGSATADPVRLSRGVLRATLRTGRARVHAPVEIIDIVPDRHGVTLLTRDGVVLYADTVVFCTGYELPGVVSRRHHRVRATWAMAADPARGARFPDWLRDVVVWEASDPYLYLRGTRDGAVIGGGLDEQHASRHRDRATLVRKTTRIAHDIATLLDAPPLRVTHRWAGAFGESSTGLPTIGRLPTMARCHVVSGFGGNGITYSMIASEVIARALAGRRDPDADLYRVR